MDKYSEIAKAMGEEIDGLTKEVAAQAAVDAEKALAVKVGILERLRDLNVKEKDLEKLAVSAFNDVCTPGNPREVLMVEILELYKKAF